MFDRFDRRYVRGSSLLSLALVFCIAIFSSKVFCQETLKPTPKDSQIALAIHSLMSNRHLSKHPIDDEISQRGLKEFVDNLDPMKVYFVKSDMEEFSKQKDLLDNMMAKGDVSYAFVIFSRFLRRIEERIKVADELIEAEHDFTIDEKMATDADEIEYCENEEELRERWRKRIKYNILVLKSDKSEKDVKGRLHKRYSSFAKRMNQFDSEEIVEMFLTAMTTSFDPHSTYFSKSTYENFMIQMRLNLEGIGASLQSEDGLTIVKRIVPGGAAFKHGKLKVEDKIASVGQGTEGEMTDITDMKLDDVVAQIRGKKGTVVRLGVMPAGTNEVKIYAITREKIELKDSAAQGVVFEAGEKDDGSAYKIGVINLPSFYSDMQGARFGEENFRSSTKDMEIIIEGFKKKGIDAIVVDLRSNGGGSLPEAIDGTGLFIDTGTVVQVKDSIGRIMRHDDVNGGMTWNGPLVVVTSKFSASASEILAGAIKDYERGIVVGDTATHGKGTVQSLVNVSSYLTNSPRPLPTLGALKVTMQQFYRPGGRSTQKKGVLADIVLPSISDNMDVSEDDLDFALEFDEVRKANFDKMGMINPELIKKLSEASKKRIKSSEEFAKLERDIKRYTDQKQKKFVTLNEEKFLAQRKEFDAEKEDEKTIEEQTNPDEKIKRDYYMEEVLAITTDYVKSLTAQGLAQAK